MEHFKNRPTKLACVNPALILLKFETEMPFFGPGNPSETEELLSTVRKICPVRRPLSELHPLISPLVKCVKLIN